MTNKFNLSSASLHIIAMILMFCDHLCMTLLNNHIWLHFVGRIAYPIFAFMIVEGFRHTGNIKKYLLRMLIFALVSEIPFDLMTGGTWFFPTQQNVLWTYMISILGMLLIEQTKKIKNHYIKYPLFIITSLFTLIAGFIIGTLTMVDYFGGGVLMVLIFYFFRDDEILSFKKEYKNKWSEIAVKWMNRVMQAICVWLVCDELIGGLCYNIDYFGHTYEVVVESFGILALIPIWLYNGRKGYSSKLFKYFNYTFYPLHIALLVLVQKIVY